MHRFKSLLHFTIGILAVMTTSAQAKNEAEIIHWWVSGGEAAALQVVTDKFQDAGYKWIDTPVKASYQAKSVAISRILDSNPPTMVQWHAGIALNELIEEKLIRDLNSLVTENNWKKVIPPTVLEQISVDGKIVAIPLTLHGSNWVWANKKVFDSIGKSVPRSWQDFLEMAPTLQKSGYIPLALGGQPWQIRILFNNVLLGVGGPALYKEVMINHTPSAIESARTAEVFKIFGKLRQFTDKASKGRGWSETTKLVIEGKAALQIMGDWAKGEFTQAGQRPDRDFICDFSPGTANNYLIVTDVFVAPVTHSQEDISLQETLVKIMMDPETQRRFNIIKGSIPPRIDVSDTGFDSCSRKAMKAVAGGATIIPGFKMTNKGLISNALMDGIAHFWEDDEMTPEVAVKQLAEAIRQASL